MSAVRFVATVWASVWLAALWLAPPAAACSVCIGGDPNDAMNQGVRAGMLVLLGTAGGVLSGVGAMLIFWMRRAARLRLDEPSR